MSLSMRIPDSVFQENTHILTEETIDTMYAKNVGGNTENTENTENNVSTMNPDTAGRSMYKQYDSDKKKKDKTFMQKFRSKRVQTILKISIGVFVGSLILMLLIWFIVSRSRSGKEYEIV